MSTPSRSAEQAFAITLMGGIAFNRPLIDVFDVASEQISGTPPIFVYMFGVWGLFVVLLAFAMRRRSKRPQQR
ncbi:MAG: hypothetical protein AAF661_15720 [Pseudomonadota bacterium]